eukprot:g4140.t1
MARRLSFCLGPDGVTDAARCQETQTPGTPDIVLHCKKKLSNQLDFQIETRGETSSNLGAQGPRQVPQCFRKRGRLHQQQQRQQQ